MIRARPGPPYPAPRGRNQSSHSRRVSRCSSWGTFDAWSPCFARGSRRVLRLLTVTVLGVALLAACSGSKKHSASAGSGASSTESGAASRSTRRLTIGRTDVQRAGARGTLNDATGHTALAAAQHYLDVAVLAPLETGKMGRGFPALFESGLRPAATGPDTRVLSDLVVGPTTSLNEQSTPVTLSALLDGSGAPLYLATKFDVTIHAVRAAGGEITIARTVELTFERVGRSWLVAAYRVSVRRTVPGVPTTTTSAAQGVKP